jgi:hypothetical protein
MKTPDFKPWGLAALAALCVLLAAWLLPLPRLVAGADELAAARLPQVRASVDSTGAAFAKAQTDYLAYVGTHDMTALSTTLSSGIAAIRAGGDPSTALSALRGPVLQMQDYLAHLQPYAEAGEPYFAALQNYDDTLMAWTRSLGTDPERYRKATFPLADYRRLYPAPVGDLTPDIPWTHASEVASETAALKEHIAALDSALAARDAPASKAVATNISADVTRVWALGRSVERIESLHKGYEKVLREYDTGIQAAIAAASQSPPALSPAGGLDLLVGAVVLLGLAALFMPRVRADA